VARHAAGPGGGVKVLLWPAWALAALYLRWGIWEAECHLRSCERDGLDESMNTRAFRWEITTLRVRLADAHARMDEARAKGARLLQPLFKLHAAAKRVGRRTTTQTRT